MHMTLCHHGRRRVESADTVGRAAYYVWVIRGRCVEVLCVEVDVGGIVAAPTTLEGDEDEHGWIGKWEGGRAKWKGRTKKNAMIIPSNTIPAIPPATLPTMVPVLIPPLAATLVELAVAVDPVNRGLGTLSCVWVTAGPVRVAMIYE